MTLASLQTINLVGGKVVLFFEPLCCLSFEIRILITLFQSLLVPARDNVRKLRLQLEK